MFDRVLLSGLSLLFLGNGAQAGEPDLAKRERGSVDFKPLPQTDTPEGYRLAEHKFDFELTPRSVAKLSGYTISELTFPSPVESPYPENNRVYAEYYRPDGAGPFPGVIVLEILAGGEGVARGMASLLAQNNVAALFVRMAYYGPRSPKTERIRLLSTDIPRTLDAVRQTVLDCRRATAWLESRPEVNPKRLGIVGTSLGSFLAALTAEMEPKLGKAALLLTGGGFVDAYYDHPRAKPYVTMYEKIGGTKKLLKEVLAPADPLTYAEKLKGRDVLIIAAKRDDIVPPSMAEALWEAAGKPKIVWFNTTHYGAAMYALPMLEQVRKHFQAE
ncbi:MAG: alpha/beta hydrolase family protein [Gemmataceae bacterium]